MKNQDENTLKSWLAAQNGTHAEDWYVVTKARHAMAIVFEELRKQRGNGTVLTQSFTCVTAINPILVAGLRPCYGDIDPTTLSLDPTKVEPLLDDLTRAVVVQHTFGLAGSVEEISKLTRIRNVLLLEDSAHCAGFMATDRSGRPMVDVSVHSFGAEKRYQTSYGAAIWLNPAMADGALYKALKQRFELLRTMKMGAVWRAQAYPYMNRGLRSLPAPVSARLRAVLVRVGVLELPIMPLEKEAQTYGSCCRLAPLLTRKIVKRTEGSVGNIAHRMKLVEYYRNALAESATLSVPAQFLSESGAWVRFPVVCGTSEQAKALFERLTAQKLSPGRWYRPTLFPGVEHSIYGYDPGMCPVAEDVSAKIINLPTSSWIDQKKAKEIVREITS